MPTPRHGGMSPPRYPVAQQWWVLQEALKRNPGIKTYGLSWGVPGWIGDGGGGPAGGAGYFSDDNIRFHVDWVRAPAAD